MLNWLRRRRLSDDARRKLVVAVARAEEAIIETHVSQALNLVDALASEVNLERTIELYVELLELGDAKGEAVTNRVLARLEEPTPANAPPRRRFENVFRENRGP